MKRIRVNGKVLAICALVLAVAAGATYWIKTSADRKLKRELMSMMEMKVDLNFKEATAICNGIDSTYANVPSIRLVTFVDSTSCSGCFIGHLSDYFEVNDSLQAHGGSMLVILHPKPSRVDETILRLRQEDFPFWCIVDTEGEFIRNNPDLPDNSLMHTFVIDNNDKVKLVGDPTRNPRIKSLMLRLLNED